MKTVDRIVSTRALNYLRTIHVPTYVGLRFLLDSLPSTNSSIAVTTLVEQLSYADAYRIYSVKRFKRFDKDGKAEHRAYSVPAPTHALAESYSLYHLQKMGLRDKSSFVYSYRPPSELDYSRNYEYFSTGYAERNADVLSRLDGDCVALVFDLKNFYPSINAAKVVGDFHAEIDASGLGKAQKRVISRCAEACIQPATANSSMGGLRVGPDLSHTLADLALRVLDGELSSRYAGAYFRYVDDIVVVVSRSRAKAETDVVKSIVEAAGFKLNEEKSTIALKEAWSGYRNDYVSHGGSFDPLASFKFRLKLFLARNPELVERLSDELISIGAFLPIKSLLGATTSANWRERIGYLFRANWRVLLKYRSDSIGDILQSAKDCQLVLRRDLEKLLTSRISESPLSRRWQVQHARFLINRSLYFLRAKELARLVEFMQDIPELEETMAVALAVSGSDIGRITHMPGPTASAAAQLLSIRGGDTRDFFSSVFNSDDPAVAADIASQFGIRGFIAENTLTISDLASSDAAALLRFALSYPAVHGSLEVVGYGQEIEALGFGRSRREREEAAASRLFPDEDVVFEALSLSSAYAS